MVSSPHGSHTKRLLIDKAETVRGSCDDLECFSYQLRYKQAWWCRNAVCTKISGKDFVQYAAQLGKS